jgi:DNA modification methylase
LSVIKDKEFDHCITDPPYGENVHRNQFDSGGGIKAQPTKLDFAPLQAYQAYVYAKEIARVTKGWILAFCQAEMVGDWKSAFIAAGCIYKRCCVWVKPGARPQLSGDRPGQGFECIVCAWAGKGRSIWNGRGKLGIYKAPIPRGKARFGHPTAKPLDLMEQLVSDFTKPGEIILDPFSGSGSTHVAAKKLGRRSWGYELDENYVAVANERISL